MRRIIIIIFLLAAQLGAWAQIEDPIKWKTTSKKVAENEYDLIFTAILDPGWHIYSQSVEDPDLIPPDFTFNKGNFERIGKVKENGKLVKEPQKDRPDLRYYKNSVDFVQRIKLKGPDTKITSLVYYTVCDDSKCLPPVEDEFTFNVAYTADQKNASKPDTNSGNPFSQDPNSPSAAKDLNPVHWSFEVKPVNASDGEYDLFFTAEMEKNWHIYGQEKPQENGPTPTQFRFDENKNLEFLGIVQSVSKAKKEIDSAFGFQVWKHEEKAVFVQRIKLNKPTDRVTGLLTYMACNNRQCLDAHELKYEFDTKNMPVAREATLSSGENALLTIFSKGFIWGLAALLTPCVFPMIPLTVSFFTKKSKDRAKAILNASIFGFSIIAIYVGLGFIISRIFGPDALNSMSSNIWFNLSFFIIFIVFAFSFFGAFEITLPSSWATKADERSEKGGIIGIFFMAFTLALVSFSCTGPIIGSLLVDSFSGGVKGPISGMFGFALALALPFTLFAVFPNLMQSLPKSGGWLNSVKVVLGFIELALALKFLSVVDLAYHWDFLKREYFLAIWIIIFALMGLYLLGKLKFSHDSPLDYVSVPRLMFAIIALSFATYMVPGLWGAPLNMLSGLAPPIHYSEWNHQQASAPPAGEQTAKKYTFLHCPHGLNCFHDYDEGLAYAKEKGKPVMLDFTGHACVNCRKMEDHVWIDPQVLSMLQNDYVLISLYVDDKTSLEESEVYTSKFSGRKINTVGKKWSDFQASKYQTNSQPFYVLLDHKEQPLVEPRGYDPATISSYLQFLQSGLVEFKSRKAN